MYDANIVSYFTPTLVLKAQRLKGDGERASMVRMLIEADLRFSLNTKGDLREDSLQMYKQPRRFTYPAGRPVKIVMTLEMRKLAALRCKYLGFRLTDYPVALIARAYHHAYGTEELPVPPPSGHRRQPRRAKGTTNVSNIQPTGTRPFRG